MIFVLIKKYSDKEVQKAFVNSAVLYGQSTVRLVKQWLDMTL